MKPKGFSRARPILTDTDLPGNVDVAIIGGGFIGTATALELARRGISVALFEKGVIAGESSGRSGGLIEAMLSDPTKMDLIELSKQRWSELSSITGEDIGFLRRGSTMLFGKNKADMLGLCEGWVESVKGLPNGGARMVSAAEAARMAPGSTSPLAGGLTCPDDASAEPVYSAPAMAIGARKLGAKIYQFCAVRGLERTGGRISGVVTEKGTVKCSSVVLAGGVWSQVLAHDLGLDLRTLQCFAKGASLHPFEGPDYGTLSIVADHEVGWRKQSDGGYIVWEFTGIAPSFRSYCSTPFSSCRPSKPMPLH
ncbi:FAD-binding oxidoreductase [Novosphingobium sp. MW5]|nr:FAD-binding oxidoreductase [Novosphingobium sp. MW5]